MTKKEQIEALEAPLTPLEGSHFSHGISPCTTKHDIMNDEDYDDWEYGTEPIPGDETWSKHSK